MLNLKTLLASGLLALSLLIMTACGGGGSSSPSPQQPQTPPVEQEPEIPPAEQEPEALYPDYNVSAQAPDRSGMALNAMEIASSLKLGWNIGNTMEAIGGETYWGNPEITPELLQTVKAAGFDAIRLPVSWDQYADQSSAEISSAWLTRVKEVVQYCLDADLYVLVNIHWDGGWLENNIHPEHQAEIGAKQKAFWQQIATALRDLDQRLLFASANEPEVDDAEQMAILSEFHQIFVNTVRETGGRNAYRTLVVQGPKTDIELTNTLWTQMPTDTVSNRMMFEAHFYSPFNFTLMTEDQSWGNQFFYWGEGNHSPDDPEHNPTWGEEESVDALLGLLKAQFVDQGIPVLIGEFGPMRRDHLSGEAKQGHLDSRAYYLEYVTRHFLANGLVPFYWDTGGLDNNQSGIFNRSTTELFDPQALNALLRGAGKG